MVGDFDTPRYFQRSSICCEVLFRTENHPLEINGSCDFGITYQRGTSVGISLEVFADADYAASKATDKRSVSGSATICGGACVYWFSKTHKCATLSTSEADYVAFGDAVKELLLFGVS